MVFIVCPFCQKELMPDKGGKFTYQYRSQKVIKYDCYCLNNNLTFLYYTLYDNSPSDFYLYDKSLVLTVFKTVSLGWNWILCLNNKRLLVASCPEFITPVQAYEIFKRYQKLLIFS